VAQSDLPTVVLRVEGLALLAAAVFLYARYGDGWLLFAVLLLAPDLSLIGYTAGPAVGAVAYNVGHTTVLPLALAVAGIVAGSEVILSIALIWLAHIGMDRSLGYGLKRTTGFRDTHLGRIGRDRGAT
jgi:Domain of unknown function (DUF4260)